MNYDTTPYTVTLTGKTYKTIEHAAKAVGRAVGLRGTKGGYIRTANNACIVQGWFGLGRVLEGLGYVHAAGAIHALPDPNHGTIVDRRGPWMDRIARDLRRNLNQPAAGVLRA